MVKYRYSLAFCKALGEEREREREKERRGDLLYLFIHAYNAPYAFDRLMEVRQWEVLNAMY